MQESQETHISNHLDEVVAAVSINPRKTPNPLPQTLLFQPPREKLHLCEEKAKAHFSSHQVRSLSIPPPFFGNGTAVPQMTESQ